MKNKKSILIGTILGLFISLFLVESFQAFAAVIFGAENTRITFAWMNVFASFDIEKLSASKQFLILFSPMLLFLVLSFGFLFTASKLKESSLRFIFVLSLLIVSGYYIVYMFYGAVHVIIGSYAAGDLTLFIGALGLEYPINIGVMFLIIIIFIGYINLIMKKISVYVNKQRVTYGISKK